MGILVSIRELIDFSTVRIKTVTVSADLADTSPDGPNCADPEQDSKAC
jgi:hypothetical protein